MDDSSTELDPLAEIELIRTLSKPQRRVLGVLIEKGFTTPEYYPLTIKATTTGCNQKSNRNPVTNYSEDAVYDTLEELRELRIISVVHTETGRSERYRHYVRKHYPFTEPQLAIMTELWLRGRQQLGELRARASRMVAIDNLDELKRELSGLLKDGFIQATGPIGRRGVEVDHNFYASSENKTLESVGSADDDDDDDDAPLATASHPTTPSRPVSSSVAVDDSVLRLEIEVVREENQQLRTEAQQLRTDVQQLREAVEALKDDLDDLRRSLGA